MKPSVQSLTAGLILCALIGFASVGANVSAAEPASEAVAPPLAAIPIADLTRSDPVDFDREIMPVLKQNCLACHNRTTSKADLILESPDDMLKGGESGPAIVPNHGIESLLLKAASHETKPRMPPKDNKANAVDLTPHELALIKLWIDQGAKSRPRVDKPIAWQPMPEALNPIFAVAVTPDGQFAACARANQIFVYHLPTARLATRLVDPHVTELAGHGAPGVAHRDLIQSLAFNPDASLLASGSYREVKLWHRPQNIQHLPLQLGTAGRPHSVTVSPDGHTIAIGSEHGHVSLLNRETGQLMREFSAHQEAVSGLRFSPNNQRLATWGEDKTIRIFTQGSGELAGQCKSSSEIHSVLWLAGGAQLAAADGDNIISIWQIPDGVGSEWPLVQQLKGHEGAVTTLAAWPAEPGRLVSAGADGTVRIWDLQKGQELGRVTHGGRITDVVISGDGKRMASAGSNALIKLWECQAWQALAEIKGNRYAEELSTARQRTHSMATNQLGFQQSALAAAAAQVKVDLERVKKAAGAIETAGKTAVESEKKLKDATDSNAAAQVALVALDEDLKKALETIDAAKTLATRIIATENFESETAALIAKLNAAAKEKRQAISEKTTEAKKALDEADSAHKKAVRTESIAKDELELASKAEARSKGRMEQFEIDVATAERHVREAGAAADDAKRHTATPEPVVRALAFSPNNSLLAATADDGTIRTWSAENGAPVDVLAREGAPGMVLTFLADRLLVGTTSELVVWDPSPNWTLKHGIGTGGVDSPIADRVNALCFSRDGALLASGGGEPSRSGEIRLWNPKNGNLVQSFTNLHSDVVLSLEFSPDDRHLASGSADKFMKVLDLPAGATMKSFEGHAHHVLGVSWRLDGRSLASAGADAVIKIWDFASGERRRNIDGFAKEVTSVHFVGISDRLLAASGDNQVKTINERGEDAQVLEGPADYMQATAVTADGRIAVAGGHDSVLRVWSLPDGKVLHAFPAPSRAQGTIAGY